MRPAVGQWLRRLGLLMELIAVVGTLATRGEGAFLGSAQRDQYALFGCFAIGFLIWVTGTAAIYWGGRSSMDGR
jgi:hypothetical protein